MSVDGKVVYQVEVDSKDAESQAKKAGEKLADELEKPLNDVPEEFSEKGKQSGKNFGKNVKDGSQSGATGFKEIWTGAARAIGQEIVNLGKEAVSSLGNVVRAGIDYNATMESYQTAFSTMLGDADKAAELTEKLQSMAAATPLAMTDLADASQVLLAFGASAEQLPDTLKRLGDVSQGSAEKLGTMATAFGRIQSNGYASLEEINMMIDQGFNPLNIIAAQTGETMADLRDRVSAGGVSFEEIAAALQIATNEGGQFFNAMENQSKTFTGQISTLKDNATQLAGALTQGLFEALAGDTLPQINEWVNQLLTAIQENGISGALSVAGEILSSLVSGFVENAPGLYESGISLMLSVTNGITESIPQILETGTRIVLDLLQAIVQNLPQMLLAGVQLITSLAEGLSGSLNLVFAQIPLLIQGLLQAIISNLPQLITAGIELIGALISGIIQIVPQIPMIFYNLVLAIVSAIGNTDWVSLGANIVRGIWDGILSLWDSLLNSVTSMVTNLWQSAKNALGIASPSKKFKYVGEMSMEGAEVGFEDREAELKRTVRTIYGGVADTAQNALYRPSVDFAPGGIGYGDIERSVSYNLQATGTTGGQTITVPLYLDGREIARASAWSMGEQLAWLEV